MHPRQEGVTEKGEHGGAHKQHARRVRTALDCPVCPPKHEHRSSQKDQKSEPRSREASDFDYRVRAPEPYDAPEVKGVCTCDGIKTARALVELDKTGGSKFERNSQQHPYRDGSRAEHGDFACAVENF